MEPVSFDGNHWGVWEIAARYSDLDLNWNEGTPGTICEGAFTGCVRGGEQKIVTLGLNWYLSNNIRLMFDYLHVDVNRLNASGQQIGQAFNAIGTRLQLTN
jgi:phosphate-selective porin OprO/OprP